MIWGVKRCVCGVRLRSDKLCDRCLRITPAAERRGLRPWPWVAEQYRMRNPEMPQLTPAQCKAVHDRAIRRLRDKIRSESGAEAALRALTETL